MKTETAYDHVFDIDFTVISYEKDRYDVTPAQVRLAIIERIALLTDHELFQAVGWRDTYDHAEVD